MPIAEVLLSSSFSNSAFFIILQEVAMLRPTAAALERDHPTGYD